MIDYKFKQGPETDALIAATIMRWNEWKDWETKDYNGEFPMFYLDPDFGVVVYRKENDNEPSQYGWSPTTSIDDTMEVIEHVWKQVPKTGHGTYRFQLSRRDGESLSKVFFGAGPGDQGNWVCEFAMDPQGGWRTHSVGSANTAPMAICLAALRAVGAIK